MDAVPLDIEQDHSLRPDCVSSMFSFAISQIHRLIQAYIEPIEPQQLRLDRLYRGRVELLHVQLKQALLDAVVLPFSLGFNYIGKLNVQLSLFGNRISVSASRILLTLHVTDVNEWSVDRLLEAQTGGKRARLRAAEQAALFTAIEEGLLLRLIVKLASTVEVDVEDVHIRIEDGLSQKAALGLKIRSLRVEACEAKNLKVSDTDEKKLILKRVNVEGLALYVDDLKAIDLDSSFNEWISYHSRHTVSGLRGNKSVSELLVASASTPLPNDYRVQREKDERPEPPKGFSWITKMFGWSKPKPQESSSANPEDDSSSAPLADAANAVKNLNELQASHFQEGAAGRDHCLSWACDARFEWREALKHLCEERIQDPSDGIWKTVEMLTAEIGESEMDLLYDGILRRVVPSPEPHLLLPLPSLRVRPESLSAFVALLDKLNAGYHQYVIRDFSVFCDMALSLAPCVVHPASDSDEPEAPIAKWKSIRFAKRTLETTHPMLRMEVRIPTVNLVLAQNQIVVLMRTMGVLSDFGALLTAVQHESKPPKAALEGESLFYTRYWPIKLLYTSGPTPLLGEHDLLPLTEDSYITPPKVSMSRRQPSMTTGQSVLEIIQWLSWFEREHCESTINELRQVALKEMKRLPLDSVDASCKNPRSSQCCRVLFPSKDVAMTPDDPASTLMMLLRHFGLDDLTIKGLYTQKDYTELVELGLSMLDVTATIALRSDSPETTHDLVVSLQGLSMGLVVAESAATDIKIQLGPVSVYSFAEFWPPSSCILEPFSGRQGSRFQFLDKQHRPQAVELFPSDTRTTHCPKPTAVVVKAPAVTPLVLLTTNRRHYNRLGGPSPKGRRANLFRKMLNILGHSDVQQEQLHLAMEKFRAAIPAADLRVQVEGSPVWNKPDMRLNCVIEGSVNVILPLEVVFRVVRDCEGLVEAAAEGCSAARLKQLANHVSLETPSPRPTPHFSMDLHVAINKETVVCIPGPAIMRPDPVYWTDSVHLPVNPLQRSGWKLTVPFVRIASITSPRIEMITATEELSSIDPATLTDSLTVAYIFTSGLWFHLVFSVGSITLEYTESLCEPLRLQLVSFGGVSAVSAAFLLYSCGKSGEFATTYRNAVKVLARELRSACIADAIRAVENPQTGVPEIFRLSMDGPLELQGSPIINAIRLKPVVLETSRIPGVLPGFPALHVDVDVELVDISITDVDLLLLAHLADEAGRLSGGLDVLHAALTRLNNAFSEVAAVRKASALFTRLRKERNPTPRHKEASESPMHRLVQGSHDVRLMEQTPGVLVVHRGDGGFDEYLWECDVASLSSLSNSPSQTPLCCGEEVESENRFLDLTAWPRREDICKVTHSPTEDFSTMALHCNVRSIRLNLQRTPCVDKSFASFLKHSPTRWPFLSVHINEVVCSYSMMSAGSSHLSVALWHLEVSDQSGISPPWFNSLYSSRHSSVFPHELSWWGNESSSFFDFGEVSDWSGADCPLSHRAFGQGVAGRREWPHVLINLHGDLTRCSPVRVAASVSTIRIGMPLELLDELGDWGVLRILRGLPVFAAQPTPAAVSMQEFAYERQAAMLFLSTGEAMTLLFPPPDRLDGESVNIRLILHGVEVCIPTEPLITHTFRKQSPQRVRFGDDSNVEPTSPGIASLKALVMRFKETRVNFPRTLIVAFGLRVDASLVPISRCEPQRDVSLPSTTSTLQSLSSELSESVEHDVSKGSSVDPRYRFLLDEGETYQYVEQCLLKPNTFVSVLANKNFDISVEVPSLSVFLATSNTNSQLRTVSFSSSSHHGSSTRNSYMSQNILHPVEVICHVYGQTPSVRALYERYYGISKTEADLVHRRLCLHAPSGSETVSIAVSVAPVRVVCNQIALTALFFLATACGDVGARLLQIQQTVFVAATGSPSLTLDCSTPSPVKPRSPPPNMTPYELWLYSEGMAPEVGPGEAVSNLLCSFREIVLRFSMDGLTFRVCDGKKFGSDSGPTRIDVVMDSASILLKVDGCRGFIRPAIDPWWLQLNNMADLLSASLMDDLDIGDLDLERDLDRDYRPYRPAKQMKGILSKLKNMIKSRRKKDPVPSSQTIIDMPFSKSLRMTLEASPWILVDGQLQLHVSYDSPTMSDCLLEPLTCRLLAYRRTFDHPLRAGSEVSWINANVSLALVDALLNILKGFVGQTFFERCAELRTETIRRILDRGTVGLASRLADGSSLAVPATFIPVHHNSRIFMMRPRDRFDFHRSVVGAEDMVRSWVGSSNYAQLGRGQMLSMGHRLNYPCDERDDCHPAAAMTHRLIQDGKGKDEKEYERKLRCLTSLLCKGNFVNLLGQPVLVCTSPNSSPIQWKHVDAGERLPLPPYDDNESDFVIRLQLADSTYDIIASAHLQSLFHHLTNVDRSKDVQECVTLRLDSESDVASCSHWEMQSESESETPTSALIPLIFRGSFRTFSESELSLLRHAHDAIVGASSNNVESLVKRWRCCPGIECLLDTIDNLKLDGSCVVDITLSTAVTLRNFSRLPIAMMPTLEPVEDMDVSQLLRCLPAPAPPESKPARSFAFDPLSSKISSRRRRISRRNWEQRRRPVIDSSERLSADDHVKAALRAVSSAYHQRLEQGEPALDVLKDVVTMRRRGLTVQEAAVTVNGINGGVVGLPLSWMAPSLRSLSVLLLDESCDQEERLISELTDVSLLDVRERLRPAVHGEWLLRFPHLYWATTEIGAKQLSLCEAAVSKMTPLHIPVRSARDILLLNNTPASQINNRLSLSRAESVALGRPSDMVHLSSSVCVNVPFSGRTVGSGAFVEIGILPCVKVCNRLPRTVHVKRNANVLGVQPTSRLQTMKTTHHRHRVEDSEICAIVASGKEKIVPVMPAELMLSYEGLSSADVVLQRKNVSPDEPLVYSVSLFPPVRARQQSVVETESSQPERKQEALVVNVEVAADSRGEDTKSFFRRLPGPGLFRRVTVFAGYWMVNRLSYPVNLCWSGGKLACPPHQRLLVSTDIVESEKVSISLSRENCDRPPYSERYAKQAQDFGLTHSAEVSSNTFRLCAYNTSVSEPLKIDKSGITPRLSYLANISRAQQPYMRTLGLEIVPACFIHNRKTTPMFIREDPMSRLLDSYKPMGVFPIPPGGSLEFHPQLTTHRLQISGVVEVDRYFSAVMQPHVTARTLYVNKDTQKDEPLWSQAFSVAKPNVFQIRHPAIPVQKYHIGDYSQTWVEVSKNREMRVITLSDPPHAEYRVLNLSSFNLCIGQMEVDGPFEVLLPAKMDPDLRRWLETRDLSSALAPGTAVRDAVDSCALNYNFYAPNEKKKRIFEFWSACPPPPAEDPGKCRLPKDREGVVLPDCRVHWRSLMYWKGLRSHASRFNVDLHFREQKMAKLRGAPPTDRLLPLPTVGGTTINVAVRLFTGAGSRWLVLQDFRRDVMVASELSTRVETLLSDAETSADAVRELLELIRTNSGARCELRRLLALNNSMHDTLLVHLLDEGPTPGDTFSDSGSEDDSKNMDDSREISLIGEKLEFKSHVNRLVTGNSYFNTKIRGVGLSLSEGMNQTELVYLSLAKIVVGVNFAPQEELSLTLSLGWLQIDNSSLVATFPTVLRPIPNAGRIAQNLEEYEPNLLPSQDIPSGFATFTMNVSIRLSSVLDASLIDLPTLQVSVAPLSVSVDYDIIARLLTFADNVISESEFLGVIGTSGNSVALSEVDSESADWLSLLGPAVYLTTQSDAAESVVLSLESVEISELMVVLNVMTEKNWSPKSKKPGRTVSFGKVPMERPEVDCIQSELIKTVLNSISLSPSISDATIVLEKRVDKDLCGSPDQIGMEIALPYITNAAKQTHKVLGSLDLLGNPSAAVRHVERGTMDALMSLKVAFGLERNLTPQQRKRGGCTNCAVGCGGCFTKFLLGIMAAAIDVVSRCCGSWGSNCLNLSLYNDQYSLMSRLPGGINPHESGRTLMEGVWRGGVLCSSLMANSILNTLKGPAACVRCGRDGDESPECAEAASYLCKGCASGVLNLFFGLPASVALLCHHTASGLLSTIVKLPTLLPMRPPRLYLTSSRHQLTTYEFLWSSLADNTHQYLMKSHSYRGSTMENVGASLPLDLEANSLLVFGSEKIGLVRRKKGLIWACPVVEVRTLDLVVEQPRNQCFLRVVTHSESDKKTVYLAPVATISRASLLWSFLVKLIA